MRLGLAVGALAVLTALAASPAHAQRVDNDIAVFAALDKVTARISRLEIGLGQTVRFGSLKVTPRACYSRPPTEPPKTSVFVEVEEVAIDGGQTKLFSGWMFAESPGLNAVEHPVFDVWLTECAKPAAPPVTAGRRPVTSTGAQVPPPVQAGKGTVRTESRAEPPPAVEGDPADEPRRRVRR